MKIGIDDDGNFDPSVILIDTPMLGYPDFYIALASGHELSHVSDLLKDAIVPESLEIILQSPNQGEAPRLEQ